MYGGGVNQPSSIVRHTKVKLGIVKPPSSASSGGSANIYVLPPNVNGRPRGTLTVGFGSFSERGDSGCHTAVVTNGLRWNSTKAYVSVDLQLVWWGQQSASSPVATLHWEQGSSKRQNESNFIQYEVRTSTELFRRYLKSCEPIRVRLVSKRTQSVIGSAKVQIPGQIINFREASGRTTAEACGEVLSIRGFRLGEVSLELTLSFEPKERTTTDSTFASKERQPNEGKENNKMLRIEQRPLAGPLKSFATHSNALRVEGIPVPLHESSQRPLTGGTGANCKKKFHTLDADARQKILDYLTGKSVGDDGTGRSELSVLSDIRSISPAESMLEALLRYDVASLPKKQTYMHAVDCVRVLVENLKLSRAGQKEIQQRIKRELAVPAFAIKMKHSRNPTMTKLKFISSTISADGADVLFDDQPQTTRLSLTGSNVEDGLHFEFGVHLVIGSFHKTRSFFVGSAVVSVRELLEGNFSCHKRCPVRLASDDILLGALTVRMELGSRGLHFGAELIDAVLVDKGNVTLESSSDSDSSSSTITPDEKYPVYHGWTAEKPRSCGHYSVPVGCHHQELHLHGGRECMSHTGSPANNQSPSNRDDPKGGSGKPPENQRTSSSTGGNGSAGERRNESNGGDQRRSDRDAPKAMETEHTPCVDNPKLLHGLLHLGQLKPSEVAEHSTSEHFLVCHSFWTDEPSTLTSELCPEGGNFNYLRTFHVLPTESFIKRVRNQHMQVELWQKPPTGAGGEKLIGVTRLPLHQFYIAFRDAQLSEHLSHAKLPVISIDGWSGVGSPLAAEPCGQIHAILAIGTESQIEHFKLSRNLLHTSGDAPRSRAGHLPSMPSSVGGSPTRRIYPRADHKSIQTMSSSNGGGCGGGGGGAGCAKPAQTLEVANMLSAFIENLAQRLPISSERSTAPASYDTSNIITSNTATTVAPPAPLDPSSFLRGSPHSQANRPQMRKTADLLDNLQKALAQRPPASALDGMGLVGCAASLLGVASTPADQTPPAAGAGGIVGGQSHEGMATGTLPAHDTQSATSTFSTPANPSEAFGATDGGTNKASPAALDDRAVAAVPPDECKLFRVAIEIEQAVNLPKLTISKKYAKRHKNRNVPDTLELEPSAYATFEGYNLKPGLPHTVKSHEGIVYTTHVLERNCAPAWQKRFEVLLPVDLMMNDEKRFILKVWRKAALSDAPKCRLLPAPMEDAVIGFCAIDLSVLLSGMPYILGWYAIMDFSGRCNGQIKVNIHPLEDVQLYKTLDEQLNFQVPLSIDVDCGGTIGLDTANTSLSRALKRKFTELEEITERLKARLFDVTGDESLDPDDQFERDLNTEADEADDDTEWPDPHVDMSNQKRNSQYPNGALTLTTNTSSYSMCASGERRSMPERSLTGCSNRAQTTGSGSGGRSQMSSKLQLAELLQTHDIDTLINPAILKNLLNASTSDSTPPLGDDGEAVVDHASATDADMSDDSSLSCRSSLPVDSGNATGEPGTVPGSGDKMKQIATALQRASLSESSGSTGGGPLKPNRTGGKCRQAPEGEPMHDSNN